jgi:hypothetical protein
MVAMMDFGSPDGLALASSQIVISGGRICPAVVKNPAVTDRRYGRVFKRWSGI